MQKLAYPLEVRKAWTADPSLPIDIDAPIADVIDVTARILGKEVRDVMVCVLDRPRNEQLVEDIRRKGAALRMIQDGDIAAALAPAMRTSDIDLYAGIGGAPEAILSAAGLRCLGGGMRAKIWPRDEAERKHLVAVGWGDRLDRQFMSRDLARGDNIVFVATGISTSPLLPGVRVRGSTATTHSPSRGSVASMTKSSALNTWPPLEMKLASISCWTNWDDMSLVMDSNSARLMAGLAADVNENAAHSGSPSSIRASAARYRS
jgi:fructose-1,6-bisphosphatase II